MPIAKSDDERGVVMEFCEALRAELSHQQFDGEPVRVRIDGRDSRDRKWQWIKKGVPIRLEVGPRDIEGGTLMPARRDFAERPPKVARNEFVAKVADHLADIQQSLFDRAAREREAATVKIDSLAEFEKFFTPKNAENPEIHGGLAWCHFVESPAMEEKLRDLKATVRCVPVDADDEPGKCIFTGQPAPRRGLFAKGY
jgi:prolyl-tRNA synthetase